MKSNNLMPWVKYFLFGCLVVFTTCQKPEALVFVPTVSTAAITSITDISAMSGGSITDDGGEYPYASGICWSTTSPPTIADSKTTEYERIYSNIPSDCHLTGLKGNTTYYVRAFATNSAGTGYGNELSFKTWLGIGAPFQGGILAYYLQPDDPGYDPDTKHGLIAAPYDQNAGIDWGCSTSGDQTGQGIGDGEQNTINIINACGAANSPAQICYDLDLGGYSDWFLPSIEELSKLNDNSIAIGGFVVGFDGNGYYWSSSIFDMEQTWYFNFPFDFDYYSPWGTNVKFRVRAIRYF